MIRIDGSGILDKFTLLKLIIPRIALYWELHGFPEENYTETIGVFGRLSQFKSYLRRRLLSYRVDMVISISQELAAYAKTRIHVNQSVVIPNFVLPSEYHIPPRKHDTALDTLSKRFLVYWGGGAELPWQALDVIELVAKKTYAKDPSILFVIAGSDAWHSLTWRTNIILTSRLLRLDFLRLIEHANVCLALYHAPKQTPFYFSPLKILDYMALSKPVIATNQTSIRHLITHGINGLLTDNAPADITAKILLLKQSAAYAKQLGDHAKQTIMKHYTLKQAQQHYAGILNRPIT